MRRILLFTCAVMFSFLLAACDTAEERAEEHYQSALALLAEGDVDRAMVELRNVLPLVPNHLEARHELARILLEDKQRPQQAYVQYLRIVEQYPDDLKARTELAEMAFFVANWEEMDRHGTKARELAPDDLQVQIIAAVLDYRGAVEVDDEAARKAAVRAATDLVVAIGPRQILRELILDDHLRDEKLSESLTILDGLTEDFPDTKRYWLQRLQVLIALDDQDAIEAQLIGLVERFPEDAEQKQILIRYYLSREELDKTEAFLRELVAESPEGDVSARMELVLFLLELRGVDAARAEIADAVETETNIAQFLMLDAAMEFASGETESAITKIEAAIEDTETSEQKNQMRVSLARMLVATGNVVGARAQVETVLDEDGADVGALKMHAAWLIEADDTDGAIAALRTALDVNPDDPETLTLMARAYSRTGSTDLSRDFLALAVEASGNAPEQTVRYANLLISEERFLPAEDVLLPAIRLEPNNVELLRSAGQLYIEMEDLGRTEQVIETLRRIDTPQANQLAVQLEAARLSLASGTDEALGYLEGLANASDADISDRILFLRARLSTGDVESALDLAESLFEDEPDATPVRLVLATTLSVAGEYDRALEIYAGLLADFPNEARLNIEVAGLQVRQGDPDAARATISVALTQNPNDPALLWASASYLESDGNIEGAIDIYEQMYALDSNNIIVANNLASLLATYFDDSVSLDRAWVIARRFRDYEQPAVQDTFGWIAHRRGDSEDALPYLESAAQFLDTDAIVQFHLGEVLFALDRKEEALEQYRTALDLAGIGDTREQIAIARARIAEIQDALSATE